GTGEKLPVLSDLSLRYSRRAVILQNNRILVREEIPGMSRRLEKMARCRREPRVYRGRSNRMVVRWTAPPVSSDALENGPDGRRVLLPHRRDAGLPLPPGKALWIDIRFAVFLVP